MAKTKKICRICGKEYTPCNYCENDQMAFHYRAICCSRNCAQVYLARVLGARQKVAPTDSDIGNISSTSVEMQEEQPLDQEPKQIIDDKPKRRYVKKKQVESESSEQIEVSVGTSD